MTINCSQLKTVIVEPALNCIGLFSDAAVNLLLGTTAQETLMGRYIVQTDIAPFDGGIGIYQMQQKTYDYIWDRRIEASVAMKAKIKLYLGYDGKPMAARMASDLALATIMARLYYANNLEMLPEANDLKGLARYYKIYWNTMSGSATEDQFIANYKEYVI
jgi:hypothetical protein